jgi:Fe2+ transport system protein FeoA
VFIRGPSLAALPQAIDMATTYKVKITDDMAEKLVKMGIPKGAIYETKLVTPAKAEKLTWEKKDGTKVALTDRQLKRMEQEYVVKLAGKLTVAPESDGRPAVITNAAPLFSAVEAAPAAESLPSWLS